MPVLFVVIALVAGCASPAPTAPPAAAGATPGTTADASPGATGITPLPSQSQVPTPSPSTGPGTWGDVELLPLVQVATLDATHAVTAGVLPDTSFLLTSLDGRDPRALADGLVAEPAITFAVANVDGSVATLRPTAPLRTGQQYRVSLRSTDGITQAAWAVQTVKPLHVVNTVPGDTTTGVPLDTGIELTFDQDGVALSDVASHVSITPRTAGRFVQSDRSFAFVPDEPLLGSTLYTVVVRHGMPLAGTAMTLEQDATFAFETAGKLESKVIVTFDGALTDASLTERAAIGIHLDRSDEAEAFPTTLGVTVHRLPDLAAAIKAWQVIGSAPTWTHVAGTAPVETASLPVVMSGDLRLKPVGSEDDWYQWIQLPAALETGWYVVTATHDGVPRQVVLQVTDLSAYSIVSNTQTLVWVNDLGTKRPVTDASVAIAGKGIGRTGADGLLLTRTPADLRNLADEAEISPIVVRSGDRAVFVPITGQYCEKCLGAGDSSPWWVVLEPDRYLYRQTDTVNVWGVARDRDTGAIPGSVEVRLTAWDWAADTSRPVLTRTASPDASGAFLVHLDLDQLPAANYTVELLIDGKHVADRSIDVGPISKPAWWMTLSTDKHAVLTSTKVKVRADASFFEGTPVAGAGISVAADESDGKLVTNALGAGSASVRLAVNDESQWNVAWIEARPTMPEEGEITANAQVAVFRSTILLRADGKVDGSRLTVTGKVNDVAFGRFERPGLTDLDAVDPYGKARAGVLVKVSVVEKIPVLVKVGTSYDFILKRVSPKYETHERSVYLGARTVRTAADGSYRLTWKVAGGHHGYDITATAADAKGRTVHEEAWAEAFDPGRSTDSAWLGSVPGSPDSYSIGDPVKLAFSGGAGKTPSSRYLYVVAQDGIRSVTASTSRRFTTPFRASYVPGVDIAAVRFTGTGYEVPWGEFTARFKASDRKIDVRLTPDKARYAPGGSATIAVRTTDADGRPVAASVFVGVVDEKLFAIGAANDSDPLGELYALVGSGISAISWSHRTLGFEGGGGGGGDTTGGGGEGGAPRSDFRDWLVAKMIRTGGDGRATVSFDLSDDLTSWRATASAVTARLEAGVGVVKLPVGLPFFAEVTVAPEYLAADHPVIRVRGYGGGIAATQTVTFQVSSDTLPMAPVTVTAKAFGTAEVPLPALTVGVHRLTVVATVGTGADRLRDSLVRTFRVVQTRTLQGSTTYALLDAPTGVTGGPGLTTLTLSDAGRGRVIPLLEELTWVEPARADRVLAAALAVRVLKASFGMDTESASATVDIGPFTNSGGLSAVPWGSDELELTALAALTGDPRLDANQLGDYFENVDTTSRERQLWALVGRAALGGGVLADVRSLAARTDLTVNEQVVLALAALAAGDETTAGALEHGVLEHYGQRLGPWVRVHQTVGDDAVTTARLAIVAASLGDPVAADMDAYVAANLPKGTAVDLERALAARGWADRVAGVDSVAAITVDGKRETVKVDASAPLTLVLVPAQVASARLEPVSGKVLVTTVTEKPLDPASLTAPAGQAFARTMRPAGTISSTDTVVVEFSVKLGSVLDDGCWTVTDFAPSGLAPLGAIGNWYWDQEEGDGPPPMTSPWRISGQRVDFCVTRDPKRVTQTLRYLARVVTPGTYAWEPAVLQSGLIPDQGSVAPASQVTIAGLK